MIGKGKGENELVERHRLTRAAHSQPAALHEAFFLRTSLLGAGDFSKFAISIRTKDDVESEQRIFINTL